jgi:hypothetical protein
MSKKKPVAEEPVHPEPPTTWTEAELAHAAQFAIGTEIADAQALGWTLADYLAKLPDSRKVKKPTVNPIEQPVLSEPVHPEPVSTQVVDDAAVAKLKSAITQLEEKRAARQAQHDLDEKLAQQEEQKLIVQLGALQQAQSAAAAAMTKATLPDLVTSVEASQAQAREREEATVTANTAALAERFTLLLGTAQHTLKDVQGIRKGYESNLEKLAGYQDVKLTPADWDAKWRMALSQRVGIPAGDVLTRIRHLLHHGAEAITAGQSIVDRGWRPGQEWALHVEETVRSLQALNADVVHTLDNDLTVLIRELGRITEGGQKSTKDPSRKILELVKPPSPASLPLPTHYERPLA